MEELKGRAIGGKARIAKMTEEEKKAHAMKMVESRRARAVMPKAAYRGVVYIGDIEFPCAVLEDGRRVKRPFSHESNIKHCFIS